MPIRVLTPADADIYFALRLEMLTHDPQAFGSDAEQFSQRSLESVAEGLKPTAERLTLGAFDGTGLVGTATLGRETGAKTRHKAGVYGVYVTPSARGRGLARELMQQVVSRARELDGVSTLIIAVAEPQAAARALYSSLGAVQFGFEPDALRVNGESVAEYFLRLEL